MNAQKKGSGCPIADALAEIEKANMDFDKRLEKDAAACRKNMDSAKKKLKKQLMLKQKRLKRKKSLLLA